MTPPGPVMFEAPLAGLPARDASQSSRSALYAYPEFETPRPPATRGPLGADRTVSERGEIAWERAHPAGRIDERHDADGTVGELTLWNFAVGSADLKPDHRRRLAVAVPRQFARLRADPTAFISIEGHSSPSGSPQRNRIVAQNRANRVKAFLVSRGLPASQITIDGLGSASPWVPNTTPENLAMNRRVVLRLAQLT